MSQNNRLRETVELPAGLVTSAPARDPNLPAMAVSGPLAYCTKALLRLNRLLLPFSVCASAPVMATTCAPNPSLGR
ncbi:hypothetical protein GALL_528100 [mine drainage metagenome]|uniref:Uncharacterized protein n=1 Tax=mine drainage metagenome TaxID=410659 RepID=A0A1J5PPY9_9ZZZZ